AALIPGRTFGSLADLKFVWPVLEARILTAILSTLAILVAYRFARAAFGSPAGLIAATLVALSALLIQLGHFATPDSTTILLMSLTLLVAYRASVQPSLRGLAAMGVLGGAAIGTEYHMIVLVAPGLAAWWMSGNRRWSWLGAAAAGAILTFLILNVYMLFDFQGFWSATEHTLRIRTVDSALQYGNRWAPYDPTWLYVVRFPLGYGTGFALAIWYVAGFLWSLYRRTRADWILLAWISPYFLLVSIEPAKFMRYSAPLLVPLAILAARLLVELCTLFATRRRAILVVLAAAALVYTAIYDFGYVGLFSTVEPRAAAAGWLTTHATSQTKIAFEVIPDGVVNLPYFLKPADSKCFSQYRVGRLQPMTYVVFDSYAPEEQPPILDPLIARYRRTLQGHGYTVAAHVHDVPTFLGLRFPIDGSPHDWRYASHEITIYRNRAVVPGPSRYCFKSLSAAAAALYVRPSTRTG
ncbi:MAG: glycosyltransferase family 39 protein, partial [Chloroflexota bacterium]